MTPWFLSLVVHIPHFSRCLRIIGFHHLLGYCVFSINFSTSLTLCAAVVVNIQ